MEGKMTPPGCVEEGREGSTGEDPKWGLSGGGQVAWESEQVSDTQTAPALWAWSQLTETW